MNSISLSHQRSVRWPVLVLIAIIIPGMTGSAFLHSQGLVPLDLYGITVNRDDAQFEVQFPQLNVTLAPGKYVRCHKGINLQEGGQLNIQISEPEKGIVSQGRISMTISLSCVNLPGDQYYVYVNQMEADCDGQKKKVWYIQVNRK